MYEQVLDINTEICIICLENIEPDTKFNDTICGKCDIIVHKDCINKWFNEKNKKICPICLKSKIKVYNQTNNNNYSIITFNLFKKFLFITIILITGYFFILHT